jgi:hypothetical protein
VSEQERERPMTTPELTTRWGIVSEHDIDDWLVEVYRCDEAGENCRAMLGLYAYDATSFDGESEIEDWGSGFATEAEAVEDARSRIDRIRIENAYPSDDEESGR